MSVCLAWTQGLLGYRTMVAAGAALATVLFMHTRLPHFTLGIGWSLAEYIEFEGFFHVFCSLQKHPRLLL